MQNNSFLREFIRKRRIRPEIKLTLLKQNCFVPLSELGPNPVRAQLQSCRSMQTISQQNNLNISQQRLYRLHKLCR